MSIPSSIPEVGEQSFSLRLVDALASFERAYARWVEAPLQNTGLTHARVRLLGLLDRGGPQIMSALSDDLLVSPRNVTVLVDALEASGLVQRKTHPTDRRAILIELTPQGVETCAVMYAQHIGAVAGLFSDLSDSDQRELLRLLNILGTGLERRGVIDEYPRSEL
jgi:DNA-binding MarR family transcriptional regulator